MHIIGLNDTSSTFCFFVFFGLINFIKEFINTAEAEEYIRKDKNRKSRNIGDCCLGKQKMAYGYKWKWVN